MTFLNNSVSASALALTMLMAAPSHAQSDNESTAEDGSSSIIVTGLRQAYRGDFDTLETPQADQIIDNETLVNSGAQDLVSALDLSASVARQNNFGGLWNAFSVRGFHVQLRSFHYPKLFRDEPFDRNLLEDLPGFVPSP